jgi:asparagine synthase (glutamine-hydrolysing)
MQHRGPDGADEWIGSCVGLAVCWSNTGEPAEPVHVAHNERTTIRAALDGVIYNGQHLLAALERKGHCFRTKSDADILVHAYEEWGRACVRRLRGMFSFAIWDGPSKALFLGRDHLGQKPLFYHHGFQCLIFGSELRSILQSDRIGRHVKLDSLSIYLDLGYVPAPDTIIDGVCKLPAGCTLWLRSGQVRIEEYWDLHFNKPEDRDGSERTKEEWTEQVRHAMKGAVRASLPEKAIPAVLLSGGVDSSALVGFLSRASDRPIKTFSAGFGDGLHNELPFANVVAQHFGTEHHELVVNSCSPDLLKEAVRYQDQPIADPAIVPTYLALREVFEETPIAFVGTGGDELFGGHAHYSWDRRARVYRVLPGILGQRLLPVMARGVNRLLGRSRFHERTIWYLALPREAGLLAWRATLLGEERRALCGTALRSPNVMHGAADVLGAYHYKSDARDPLQRLIYADTMLNLSNNLCMKADKAGVAACVQVRSPFLDHHLMEFAATIPPSLKLRGDAEKYILRRAVRTLLPREISEREKRAFLMPVDRWLREELRDLLFDLTSVGLLAEKGLFNVEYVRGDMWKGLEEGQPGRDRQLWMLLTLGLWAQRYNPIVG